MVYPKIYIDLDSVIFDFHKKVREHGVTEWGDHVWAIIENIPNVFRDLELMPYAKTAFDIIYDYELIHGVHVSILTALPKPTKLLVTSEEDKIHCVRAKLSKTVRVFCSEGWQGKAKWAEPNAILIDDMQRNIDHWEQSGGIGIRHDGDWFLTLHKLDEVMLGLLEKRNG